MIFGRKAPQYDIETALDRLGSSESTFMLFEGPPGAGKSTMLDFGASLGEQQQFPVIRGSGNLIDAGRTFGPLCAQWPELGVYTAGTPGEGTNVLGPRPASRAAEIDHFLDLVESAAPCVVTLDDLQWVDDTTLFALLAAFGRRDDLPIVVLAARRLEPVSPALAELVDVLHSCDQVFPVDPLGDEDVLALAAELLGGPLSPALAKVLGRAGGNPFYLHELCRQLASEGLVVDSGGKKHIHSEGTPDGVLDLVARRVGRLPERLQQLVEVTSVFGGPFSAAAAAEIAGLGITELVTALDEAARLDLFVERGDEIDFVHDLLREGAYHRLSRSTAQLLHRRVADYLNASGTEPAKVAQQILRGGAHNVLAVEQLVAGGVATLSSNPQLAHQYFLRAIEYTDAGDPARSERLAYAARALFWSGRTGDAEVFLDAEIAAVTGADALVLETLRAEILFIQGRLKDAAAAFEHIARQPGVDKPGLRFAEAGVCLLLGGDMENSKPLLELGVERGRAGNEGRGVAEALGGLCWYAALGGFPDQAVELGYQAVAAADADTDHEGHRAIPWIFVGQALNWADRSDEALEAFRKGEEQSHLLGVGWHEPLYNAAISGEYVRAGQWDHAVARAESVLAYSADTASRMTDAWAYATLIEVHRRRNDLDQAEHFLAGGNDLIANGASQGIDLVLWQQAMLSHQTGDSRAGFDLLYLLWNHLNSHGVAARAREFAVDTLHLALATNNVDTAWQIAAAAETAARTAPHPIYEATAHRCRAVVERDGDEMRAALRLIQRSPRPIEVAGYFEDGAVILLENGRAGQARPWAQEAVKRYRQVGARADELRLKRRLAEFGFTLQDERRVKAVSGWASLTSTEALVAERVALGLKNAEIARDLGVSRRTIESHLYRIYPKLEVANRVELILAGVPDHP